MIFKFNFNFNNKKQQIGTTCIIINNSEHNRSSIKYDKGDANPRIKHTVTKLYHHYNFEKN